VLKPGGRAVISHFYRQPSWLYGLSLLGRESIRLTEADPPVNEFLTEKETLAMNVFAFFFATFNVSKPEAVAYAWPVYGMVVLQGIVGGMVYALRR